MDSDHTQHTVIFLGKSEGAWERQRMAEITRKWQLRNEGKEIDLISLRWCVNQMRYRHKHRVCAFLHYNLCLNTILPVLLPDTHTHKRWLSHSVVFISPHRGPTADQKVTGQYRKHRVLFLHSAEDTLLVLCYMLLVLWGGGFLYNKNFSDTKVK